MAHPLRWPSWTSDPNQVVVSFDCGDTLLYDLNTEQSIIGLETQTKDGENHPTVGDVKMCCINQVLMVVCIVIMESPPPPPF